MEEIIKIFETTFQDKVFSRAEKRAVRQILTDNPPNKQQQDFLRHKIYEMARGGVQGFTAESVINWLEEANKSLVFASSGGGEKPDERVYFSPGDACVNAILTLINGARKALKICVFTISDDRISDAIIAAHRRRVKVQVITDDDKLFDLGSDVGKMSKASVPIRTDTTPNHMHHKFALIDNETTITGSYNWTRSAATHNEENILITDSKTVHEAYNEEFNKLWRTMKPYA